MSSEPCCRVKTPGYCGERLFEISCRCLQCSAGLGLCCSTYITKYETNNIIRPQVLSAMLTLECNLLGQSCSTNVWTLVEERQQFCEWSLTNFAHDAAGDALALATEKSSIVWSRLGSYHGCIWILGLPGFLLQLLIGHQYCINPS